MKDGVLLLEVSFYSLGRTGRCWGRKKFSSTPVGSPDLKWINRRKKKNYIPKGNMASYPLEYEAQG